MKASFQSGDRTTPFRALLLESIRNNDLLLFEQSIVPTSADGCLGPSAEMLVALPRLHGAPVRAEQFMTTAKDIGLFGFIDRFVVREVVDYLISRYARGASRMEMCAINLSGPNLCDFSFENYVGKGLSRLKHPEQICFEVTESELIPNLHTKPQPLCAESRHLGVDSRSMTLVGASVRLTI